MKVSYFTDAYVDHMMLVIIDAALAGKSIFYTVIPDDTGMFKTNRSQHNLHIEDQGIICKWIGNPVSNHTVRTITVEEAQQLLDGERRPK